MPAPRLARPRVLFLALADNVGCERVIGEMALQGARCAVLSPPGFYCTHTRFAERRFALPPQLGIWLANVFVHASLEVLARAWRPALIVPLDDVAASLMRGLAVRRRTSSKLRRILRASLGDPRGYAAASSRTRFLQLAESVGVRFPPSLPVGSTAALMQTIAGWSWPVVAKIEGTCGGCGVSLAPDAAALHSAVAAGLDATSWSRWLKGTTKHTLWRVAGHFPPASQCVQVQQFVRGRPAMRTVAALNGRELAGVSFLAECVHPEPTGSSTVLTPLDHDEMEQASRRLVAALGVSGIVSFDFIVEDGTGHAHVIEMNPRPIGATHLGRLFGQDVCGALIRALGWPTATPAAIGGERPIAIAAFPKELERSPDSSWLTRDGTLHDVPWEDQPLLDAYLLRLDSIHPNAAQLIRR